jgi:hypothetical protein
VLAFFASGYDPGMDSISIVVGADVVERQELLNGNVTVTFEGESADGAWTLSGSLTWNRGLEAGAEEGDLTLAGPPGDLFLSLVEASVGSAEDADAAYRLHADYEADGGTGAFSSARGSVRLEGALAADRLRGTLTIST